MGFLDFDGSNGDDLKKQFTNHVKAAGEKGCGFESSLESWYRFLVDPAPPQSVQVQNNFSSPVGVDKEVLKERAAFLRPDSLLAIPEARTRAAHRRKRRQACRRGAGASGAGRAVRRSGSAGLLRLQDVRDPATHRPDRSAELSG